MEHNTKLVLIDLGELEAMIDRVIERKLCEHLRKESNTLDRDGRMSLKDVMAALDISKQCVYNWLASGKLPKPTYIGRRLYWSVEAIKGMMP